jgi:hypothetical protein
MRFFRLASLVGALLTSWFAARLAPGQTPCKHPCGADPGWFPVTELPKFQKPDPDVDCEFYRPAWQYLLYLTQEAVPGSGPRLLDLDRTDDLFGHPAISRFPKAHKGVLALAPRVALDRDPMVGAEINQAGSKGILVDQSTGRAVYYSVHFNEVFSKFIRDHKLDDALNLKNAPPDLEFPRGAAEIKTSWRILPDNDPGDGFITAKATISKLASVGGEVVIDSNATEANKTVALLGIHVVFVLDGHPEFIWATFEHDNNAPELNRTRVTTPPGAAADETVVDNAKSWTLYHQGTAAKDCNIGNKGSKQKVTLNAAQQTLSPVTQVFRRFHFGNDDEPCVIETLNQSVHNQLTAALQTLPPGDNKTRMGALRNYSLRGAMWLNNPAYFREDVDVALLDELNPSSKILGGDPQLSNAAIETFTQPWNAATGNPASRNSKFCFDCHRTMPDSRTVGSLQITLGPKRLNVSQTLVQRYFQAQEQLQTPAAPPGH